MHAHRTTQTFLLPLLLLAASSKAQNPSTSPSTNTTSVINYFFVFVALGLCILAGVLYLYVRRRKRRTLAQQSSRQDALARDLGTTAWPVSNERWGARRGWLTAPREEERVEGLNEEGEAPPPYLGDAHGVRRPERVVVRHEERGKPPDYEERHLGTTSEGGTTPGVEARMEL